AVCDFLHGGASRRDDRRAARHGLEDRNAEAFVQRWIRHAGRAAVQTRELCIAHLTQPAHAVSRHLDTAPAARAHDAQLGVETPNGLDETIEVLARLQRADGEHVLALLRRT